MRSASTALSAASRRLTTVPDSATALRSGNGAPGIDTATEVTVRSALSTGATRSAWAELIAARAAWEATAGTVQQATRAYEIADVRYRAGVSTQLELSDSRLLLQQADANRALAARDLQVARARVALLPELPLGGGGATGGAARPATGQGTLAAPQPQQQQPGRGQFTSAAAQQGQPQTGTR